jgi:redox-sensing transcriptional repressor
VSRLPLYLRALTDFNGRGISSLSSEELAAAAGVRPTQLRKDLSHLGAHGVRGVGYDPARLTEEITAVLGLTRDWPVAICGLGNLGRALAAYSGFATKGFRLVALLDHDPTVVGEQIGSMTVCAMPELPELVYRHGIAIGVIATPSASAQAVADAFVAAGVSALLNFAPTTVSAPAHVTVRRVDIATELHVLAFHREQQRLAQLGVAGVAG